MTSRQKLIDLLNENKQRNSETIIRLIKKYESASTIYSKKYYKSAIDMFKVSILIIDVILKNNKHLYDKVLLKFKELSTEFLETTNDCCINDKVNDETYRKVCKFILGRVELIEMLVEECKKIIF